MQQQRFHLPTGQHMTIACDMIYIAVPQAQHSLEPLLCNLYYITSHMNESMPTCVYNGLLSIQHCTVSPVFSTRHHVIQLYLSQTIKM